MRWMWIDRIVSFEPRRRMTAVKNVSLAEEHLHDHFPADADRPAEPVMPASLIIEGMAQTAGILVGSVNNFREKVILAKIVRAELREDIVPGESILFDATLDSIDPRGASTSGLISTRGPDDVQWREIGRIDLLFSHIDQNLGGLEFPEENFVFSDNFRTVLRAAGLESLAAPSP